MKTLIAFLAMSSIAYGTDKGEHESHHTILVDLGARTLSVHDGTRVVHTFRNIEYGRKISRIPRSYGTPTGTFQTRKEPYHDYGKVLRLCGPDGGDIQGKRGILIHRDLDKRSHSNGCIHLKTKSEMNKLFDLIPHYARIIITE